jgi:hypothetical protein
MQKHWLVVATLVVAGCATGTLALAETAKKKKQYTPASRMAVCKADCGANGLHGRYRPYHLADPNLRTPEGKKLYAECVQLCIDPLPEFHVWKAIIESGGSVVGMTKEDCMRCHSPGKPKRFWAGVITPPVELKANPE